MGALHSQVPVFQFVRGQSLGMKARSTAKVMIGRNTIHRIAGERPIHGHDTRYCMSEEDLAKMELNESGRQKLKNRIFLATSPTVTRKAIC